MYCKEYEPRAANQRGRILGNQQDLTIQHILIRSVQMYTRTTLRSTDQRINDSHYIDSHLRPAQSSWRPLWGGHYRLHGTMLSTHRPWSKGGARHDQKGPKGITKKRALNGRTKGTKGHQKLQLTQEQNNANNAATVVRPVTPSAPSALPLTA